MEYHTIKPFYNKDSRILILGSFPSVKSRETGFYYGHPQNRLWKVLATLFFDPVPVSIEEKKAFLAKNKIAMWDVIASCEIKGSSDSSIKNVLYNDLDVIFSQCDVKAVFTLGNLAYKSYLKSKEKNGYMLDAVLLPSTSPANAGVSLNSLIEKFSIIKNYF